MKNIKMLKLRQIFHLSPNKICQVKVKITVSSTYIFVKTYAWKENLIIGQI